MTTKQIETATVVGSVTGSGNAEVIVTSAYMSNSPKTLSVAVTALDSASTVAGLIRTALAFDSDVSATFLISGAGADVVLTMHEARANDTTLNVSIDNDTCTGLTAAPASTSTLAGSGISNSYATVTEYKTWIAVRGLAGAVGTDVSDDAVIEILLEGASRYIDRESGRKYYADSADVTRYYQAKDETCVKIDDLSAAPTSVSADYNNTRSYTDMTTDDYDLLPDNALADGLPYTELALSPLSTTWFPTQRRGIKVVGKFGFPAVPADIKETCLGIAQNTYASRSGQSASGKVTVTAAGVVIRPEEVPAWAQKTIAHYRKMT